MKCEKIIIAIMTIGLLTGCAGKNTEEEKPAVSVKVQNEQVETVKQEEKANTASSSDDSAQAAETSAKTDEEIAVALAEKTIAVFQDEEAKNFSALANYVDFELMYYTITKNEYTDTEIAEFIQQASRGNQDGTVLIYDMWDIDSKAKYTLLKTEDVPDTKINILKDNQIVNEETYSKYPFDKIIAVHFTSNSKKEYSKNCVFYVVKYNNKWKVEYSFATKEYYMKHEIGKDDNSKSETTENTKTVIPENEENVNEG